MKMHVPSLNMSNLLASDAPLLSPTSDPFSPTGLDSFALNFPHYGFAPSSPHSVASSMSSSLSSSVQHSPIPGARMLRRSPDEFESEPQLCVSTHQVFNVPPAPIPEVEEEPAPRLSITVAPTPSTIPAKRPSTSTPAPAKKPRASGERVTTKEFVPPDVSGLSKREARLVKNRAAAFLSRQRKREEFETMEIRVAELEQENARLLALAGGGEPGEPQEDLVSEVEQLRRQLAAAEERERQLSEELSRKALTQSQEVKMETFEPEVPVPSRSGSMQPQNKSGASLGLMVLLCALPTLLSVPSHSTLPTTFSFPLSGSSSFPQSSSAIDMNSLIPGDYDWSFNPESIMDLDIDSQGRISGGASAAKKLEFVDVDSQALGLNGLDISFDAMASESGKIRVRIHPPASTSYTAASSPESHSDDQSMWGGSELGSSSDGLSDPELGPFLGFGGDMGFGSMAGMSVDSGNVMMSSSSSSLPSPTGGLSYPTFSSDSAFDFGLDEFGGSSMSSASTSSAGRRRVRIALKSLPGEGSEGGEWEVQVC